MIGSERIAKNPVIAKIERLRAEDDRRKKDKDETAKQNGKPFPREPTTAVDACLTAGLRRRRSGKSAFIHATCRHESGESGGAARSALSKSRASGMMVRPTRDDLDAQAAPPRVDFPICPQLTCFNSIILDVRTPGEYALGHIPGPVDIEFGLRDFAERSTPHVFGPL